MKIKPGIANCYGCLLLTFEKLLPVFLYLNENFNALMQTLISQLTLIMHTRRIIVYIYYRHEDNDDILPNVCFVHSKNIAMLLLYIACIPASLKCTEREFADDAYNHH